MTNKEVTEKIAEYFGESKEARALEYVKDISRIIHLCKDMNDREMMNYTQENRIKAEAENKVYNEIGGLVDRLIEIMEKE